jgi:hypothetical protein
MAQDDVINLDRIQASPFQHFFDDQAAQVSGGYIPQGSAEIAHGGAHR